MDLTTQAGRQELGTRIQSAIIAAGFASLPDFARQMGWSRALIYQYVGGSVLVQLDRLERIAEATGRPLEWFVAARPGAEAEKTAELAGRLRDAEGRFAAAQSGLAEERAARLEAERQGRVSEAAVLADLCRALRRSGDAVALVEAAARWATLASQTGDMVGLMSARVQMGHGWSLQGELVRAGEVLSKAVRDAQALGNEAAVHSARQELVRVLLQAGNVEPARQEAEALAAAPLWWPQWSGRVLLAAMAMQTGHLAAAARHLDEAAAIIDGGDEPAARRAAARAYLISNRVNLALAGGDYVTAARYTELLHTEAAQGGTPDQLREAELNRAVVWLRRGEVREARESLDRLDEWAAQAGDRRVAALAVILRSELARRCGEGDLARRAARRAAELAAELRHPQITAEAELALAYACACQGDAEGTQYHAGRCRKLASEAQWVRLELEAQVLSAATVEGDGASRAGELDALVARARDCGATHIEVEAQTWLADARDPSEGLQALEEAADRAAELEYFWGAHGALLGLARARWRGGDARGASEALERARALRKRGPGRKGCQAPVQAEAAVEACLAEGQQGHRGAARKRITDSGAGS